MFKRIIVTVVGLMLVFTLHAEVTKVGTTVAPFLSIEAGARAVGMGGAYVAVADGPIAMYWNPAGVAGLTKNAATFTQNNWIADLTYNFAGAVIPVPGFGVVGVNATFLTMDDMQITTISQPDGIENAYFSAGSNCIGVSYATGLTDRFSIGFNGKYIQEHIYDAKATGLAFDIGTLFRTQFDDLMIGMSISNYGSKMQLRGRNMLVQHDIDRNQHGNNPYINADLSTSEFDLPLNFRVGVSMDVLKGMASSNLVLAIDAVHPNNNAEYLNLGMEYMYDNLIALRAGYNEAGLPNSESGLSLGAGVMYGVAGTDLVIDYAYRDFGILKDVQMFTIGLRF